MPSRDRERKSGPPGRTRQADPSDIIDYHASGMPIFMSIAPEQVRHHEP